MVLAPRNPAPGIAELAKYARHARHARTLALWTPTSSEWLESKAAGTDAE